MISGRMSHRPCHPPLPSSLLETRFILFAACSRVGTDIDIEEKRQEEAFGSPLSEQPSCTDVWASIMGLAMTVKSGTKQLGYSGPV